ncbi:hypothetical protein D6856_14465 [Butyrivibrio sp. XB500-5]|uniref:hypothetical protein n=1 Tax=Butyrivibrio sp. XB500-5 TaxID=2364880 RepID=UPI000EA9C18B|nr:hypothetical protein [Butyrivibrio sp. XB500-5]RKM56698.1 hypothetical protein D6856_14465 [Butyrivibrio sp. XB500-5]
MWLKYDPTSNNKPANASSLYFDIAGFKQQQNNIYNHESVQKLDISALSAQEEVSGTECVGLLIEHWKDVASSGDEFRKFGTGVFDPALSGQSKSFIDVDVKEAESIRIESQGTHGVRALIEAPMPAPPEPAKEISPAIPWEEDNKPDLGIDPFDNKGQFGGDQTAMQVWPDKRLFELPTEDSELYEFIRKHPGYENYSDEAIYALLSEIKMNGCSYVAIANIIFDQYKDDPGEFMKRFNIPMTAIGGDLNYKQLIVDFYLETHNKLYPDEMCGVISFYHYMDKFPNAKKKIDLISEMNVSGYDECAQALVELWKHGIKEIYCDEEDRTSKEQQLNRLSHYLRIHGCDEFEYKTFWTSRGDVERQKQINHDIQRAIDEGYTVEVSAEKFALLDEKGNVQYANVDGGHAMIVTRIMPNGLLEVSTWGERLYLDPINNNPDMSIDGFMAVKRKKKITPIEVNGNNMSKLEQFNKTLADPMSAEEMNEKILAANSNIFDMVGQYGADPGGPKAEFGNGINPEKRKEILNFIKRHQNYATCDEEGLNTVLDEIELYGYECIPEVNAIMYAYRGRPKEFENEYGYSMIREDGELNTNRLLVDYCLANGICTEDDLTSAPAAAQQRLDNFLKDKKAGASVKKLGDKPKYDELKKKVNDGYIVSFKANPYDLHNELGSGNSISASGQNADRLTVTRVKEKEDQLFYDVAHCGKQHRFDASFYESSDYYAIKVNI